MNDSQINVVTVDGLSIVTTFMLGVERAVENVNSTALQNSQSISNLSQAILSALQQIQDALTALETDKADKPTTFSVSIASNNWVSSTVNEKYPYAVTLNSPKFTASSKVTVYLSPSVNLDEGKVCPVCQVNNGSICIFADTAIAMELRIWVEPGVSADEAATWTCGTVLSTKVETPADHQVSDADVASALNDIYGG